MAQATLASERGLTLMELSYKMRGALHYVAELIHKNGREDDQGVLRDFGQLVVRVDSACAIADQFLLNRINGVERVGGSWLADTHSALRQVGRPAGEFRRVHRDTGGAHRGITRWSLCRSPKQHPAYRGGRRSPHTGS